MTTIVGISGSLRRGSFNTSLLRAVDGFLPDDIELSIGSIADFPLYNADDEDAHGIPAPVAALKDFIADADALIISTPEYNNSIPGVLKNAIDWLSRPPREIPRVFGDLPVAIMGASPGRFGTVLSQDAWLSVLRTLGTELWSGRMLVSGARNVFDEAGEIQDADTRQRLATFVNGFIEFIRD